MQWELIKLRKLHRFKKKDMANFIGVTPATYRKKEEGEDDFKLTEVFILASVFNKPINEVFLKPNITKHDKKGCGKGAAVKR